MGCLFAKEGFGLLIVLWRLNLIFLYGGVTQKWFAPYGLESFGLSTESLGEVPLSSRFFVSVLPAEQFKVDGALIAFESGKCRLNGTLVELRLVEVQSFRTPTRLRATHQSVVPFT